MLHAGETQARLPGYLAFLKCTYLASAFVILGAALLAKSHVGSLSCGHAENVAELLNVTA